jgi:hypothetical protein
VAMQGIIGWKMAKILQSRHKGGGGGGGAK